LDEINDIVGSEEKIRVDVQSAAADVAKSEQAAAMREELINKHTQGMERIQNKLDNIVMGGNANGTEEQGNKGNTGGQTTENVG
jgi:RNA polymerase-binding transcription factor DksA